MPFNNISELPDAVKEKYNPNEQKIILSAFNSAYNSYKKENDKNYDDSKTEQQNRERYSFAIALSRVKAEDGSITDGKTIIKKAKALYVSIGNFLSGKKEETLTASWQNQEVISIITNVTEETAGDGTKLVIIEGEVCNEAMNKNNWGLTRNGAQMLADTLKGKDFIVPHPEISNNGGFDRSMTLGKGDAIGIVTKTDVKDTGNNSFTVTYVAEIKDTRYFDKYTGGIWTRDPYGVSVGANAGNKNAVCNICAKEIVDWKTKGKEVCASGHIRGTNINGTVVGIRYDDIVSDHLASVYKPAWKNAGVNHVMTAKAEEGDNLKENGNVKTLIASGMKEDEIKKLSEDTVTLLAEKFNKVSETPKKEEVSEEVKDETPVKENPEIAKIVKRLDAWEASKLKEIDDSKVKVIASIIAKNPKYKEVELKTFEVSQLITIDSNTPEAKKPELFEVATEEGRKALEKAEADFSVDAFGMNEENLMVSITNGGN